MRQATWASEILQIRQTHRREYRDFVVQLYQEHQIRLSTPGSPTGSSFATTATEGDKIDGKEIVAAAMNRMRSWNNMKRSDSADGLVMMGAVNKADRRKSSGSILGLQIDDSPVDTDVMTMTPTRELPAEVRLVMRH